MGKVVPKWRENNKFCFQFTVQDLFATKKRKKAKSTNHQIITKSLICCWVGLPSSEAAIHCEAPTISTRCTLPILCHASKRSGHHGKKNSYAWILIKGKGTEVFSDVLLYYTCWSDCINISPRFHLWHSFILERAAAHWLVLEGPRLPDSLYFHQMAITFNALVIHNEGLCKKKINRS